MLKTFSLFSLLLMSSAELEEKSVVIPGTKLRTGHYYSMSMSKFSSGFVSWGNSSVDQIDDCYIKVYKDRKNSNVDEVNKEWAFVPAPGEVNWYHIINRGKSERLASWGKLKDAAGNTSYVLVLKFPTSGVADHYLFRPEVPKFNVLPNRYQLKLKNFSNAPIRWIDVDGSVYLEVQQTGNTKHNEYTEESIKTLFIISGDHGTFHAMAGSFKVSANLAFTSLATLIAMFLFVFILK